METKKIEYWGTPEQETVYDDINEAIESILDDMGNPLPREIEICGFKPMPVDINRLKGRII